MIVAAWQLGSKVLCERRVGQLPSILLLQALLHCPNLLDDCGGLVGPFGPFGPFHDPANPRGGTLWSLQFGHISFFRGFGNHGPTLPFLETGLSV
jgi:hypothetical protein